MRTLYTEGSVSVPADVRQLKPPTGSVDKGGRSRLRPCCAGRMPEQLPGHRLASLTVESEVSHWKRFARPGFLIEFSYPDPTPDGQAVDRDEKSLRGYERVHLSSRDRRELYLEVVRFHDLTPEDEYLRHKPYLAQRFGADSISSLTRASLQDWLAYAYSFGWTEEGRPVERSVLLLLVAGETLPHHL